MADVNTTRRDDTPANSHRSTVEHFVEQRPSTEGTTRTDSSAPSVSGARGTDLNEERRRQFQQKARNELVSHVRELELFWGRRDAPLSPNHALSLASVSLLFAALILVNDSLLSLWLPDLSALLDWVVSPVLAILATGAVLLNLTVPNADMRRLRRLQKSEDVREDHRVYKRQKQEADRRYGAYSRAYRKALSRRKREARQGVPEEDRTPLPPKPAGPLLPSMKIICEQEIEELRRRSTQYCELFEYTTWVALFFVISFAVGMEYFTTEGAPSAIEASQTLAVGITVIGTATIAAYLLLLNYRVVSPTLVKLVLLVTALAFATGAASSLVVTTTANPETLPRIASFGRLFPSVILVSLALAVLMQHRAFRRFLTSESHWETDYTAITLRALVLVIFAGLSALGLWLLTPVIVEM